MKSFFGTSHVAGSAPHPDPLPASGERGQPKRCVLSLLPVLTGRRWRQPDEGRTANGGFGALLIAFAILLAPLPAFAVDPGERLSDPKLEQRARDLSAHLRCMVCQNQSIDDSNAELARDLRLLVRDRIVKGDSDEEVMNYIVSRYGEFVLLKPRFSAKTAILWGAPAVLFVIGLGVAFGYARRTRSPEQKTLTAEEEARLGKLLDE